MPKQKRRNAQRSGYSLLEIAIAIVIISLVLAAVYHLVSSMAQRSVEASAKAAASSELSQLLSEVSKAWKFRIRDTDPQPPYPAKSSPSAGLSASGTFPCQDLTITQRDPSDPALLVTMKFETSCVAQPSGVSVNLRAHQFSACSSGQVSRVTVTRTASSGVTQRVYPLTSSSLSMATCFRTQPAGVTVEGGNIFMYGRVSQRVTGTVNLTVRDRPSGVEYVIK